MDQHTKERDHESRGIRAAGADDGDRPDRAGGADYLLQQAQANPTAFLTLVGKLMPTKVEGDADAPVTIVVKRPW